MGLQITSIAFSVSGSDGASWLAVVADRIISSFDDVNYAAWLTTVGDGDFLLPVTTGPGVDRCIRPPERRARQRRLRAQPLVVGELP